MSFVTGLKAYLRADATFESLIGAKIWSFPAPQNVDQPYVLVQRLSGSLENHTTGSLDVVNEIWQLDIYHNSYPSAATISDAIADRLNMTSYTAMGNYFVYSCQRTDESDLSDLEKDNSENRIVRIQADYLIRRDRKPQ